jgi:DNA-binding NtrC family response regulator
MGQSQLLLIDDNQPLLDTLTKTLRREGYLVQPAINGDDALAVLQQRVPFDLLITDIFLPGFLDGFALARRAREFCPGIPIIYSTGYPQVAHIRAHNAPYGEILEKPWKLDAMLAAISAALRQRLWENVAKRR